MKKTSDLRRWGVLPLMLVVLLIPGLCQAGEVAISGSARKCILPENPFDYEFRYKAQQVDKQKLIILYEREIGLYGWGLDWNIFLPWPITVFNTRLTTEFDWYMREVKLMNTQSFRVTYDFKFEDIDCRTGFSVNTDYWDDPRLLMTLMARYKDVLELQAETNLIDRTIIYERLSKRYYLDENKRYYAQPLVEYRTIDSISDWWVRLELGAVLNPKWGVTLWR